MEIIEFVNKTLGNDQSGHDLSHIERVLTLGRYLQSKEGGNIRIIEAAILLHDCIDSKLFSDLSMQKEKIKDVLLDNSYSSDEISAIFAIIENMSWHLQNKLVAIEGKIVQDADRLDAIGAVGIIRCIEYGNSKGRKFYSGENLKKEGDNIVFNKSTNTSLSHFYDKLLHIKEEMNTKTAIEIASKREKFLKEFLKEFYEEINY